MSSSAINQSVFQAKIGSVQNQADSSGVYSNGVWSFKNSTALTSVTITDAGNVGIGTASPQRTLTLNGAFPCLQITNSTAGSGSGDGMLIFQNGLNGTVSNQENGYLNFETNNAERMRIDSSGNVGIGTASPYTFGTYKSLDIRGAGGGWLNMGTTGTSSFYIFTDGTNSGVVTQTNGYLGFSTNNIERMRIDASGILSSLPTYNNGSASAANMVVNSSGTFLRSVSALKYKQDIRDLESININNFRPVRYKSKCVGDNQTTDHFGIIADEVDAVGIKELVSYGVDGEIEGFQYDRLSVVLVKAIQEQQAQIEALKAEVAALKAP